jgi:hypothetical protein
MRSSWKFALVSAALLVACGGPLKYQVASTGKATGADAKIVAEVKKDLHQTALKVEVTNLAPPARISADAHQFVVWGRKGSSAIWTRIGNIAYDESNRGGKFEGTFPELEFDLEITVEKDDAVAAPGADVVFAQHVGPA